MSNVSQPIEETAEKAISYKIGHELNELATAAHRYIVAQEAIAHSRPLALHRGYQHIRSVLVPEMESRIVTYCLDLGVRDSDFITAKIKSAYESHVAALGQSLGVSYQVPSSAGMTIRSILEFKGWVTAHCAGLSARVFTEVAKRNYMERPKASAVESGQQTISLNQTGGVTARNYVINNHYKGPEPVPGKNDTQEKQRFRISTSVAVAGVVIAILVGVVTFAAWRWPREPIKEPYVTPPSSPMQQPPIPPPRTLGLPTGAPTVPSATPLSPPSTPPSATPKQPSREPKAALRKGKTMLDKKTGDTVISIGQQGGITAHTVIQNNPKRTFRKDVGAEWGTRNATGRQVLRLTFHQTEGTWDPGTKFWLQVDLSGPYDRAEMQGFPRALFEAGMTEGGSLAAAQGTFEFTTITPPIAGQDVVLELESAHRLEVRSVRLTPSEGE